MIFVQSCSRNLRLKVPHVLSSPKEVILDNEDKLKNKDNFKNEANLKKEDELNKPKVLIDA